MTYSDGSDPSTGKGGNAYQNVQTECNEEDHVWDKTGGVAATCTTEGYEDSVCSVCGKTKHTVLSQLGHDWSASWSTRIAATCTSDGVQYKVCKRQGCNVETTQNTSSLGHNMTTTTYSASCTSGGYTLHYCTRSSCSYSYTSNNTSALGHNWQTTSSTSGKDCQHTGKDYQSCSRSGCSATQTVSNNSYRLSLFIYYYC